MANYCNKCGRPIVDGQPCICTQIAPQRGISAIIERLCCIVNGEPSMPEITYERGRKIVPECVAADEGEIPLRQYNVAVLRSRLKLQRAEGRLEVTNKRVLFRAAGRALPGKTLLQYEFDLAELAGIEARKDYKFSLLNLFIANLILMIGFFPLLLIMQIFRENEILTYLSGFTFAAASIVPFFLLKRKYEWKLLSLGAGLGAATAMIQVGAQNKNGFGAFVAAIVGLFTIITIILYLFVPNLVLTFKTKGGMQAVDVRAKKFMGILGFLRLTNGSEMEFTGFDEVLPSQETDIAMNEVCAMINDMKTLGDIAINKWKRI